MDVHARVRECERVCIIQSSRSRITLHCAHILPFTISFSIQSFIFHSIIYIPFTIVCYVRIREKCPVLQLVMTSLIYDVVDTYVVMQTVYKMYMCV